MRSILKVNWDSNLPIYEISQSELQKKGIHCLLHDVDGTLVNRNSTTIPNAVKNWIIESKDESYQIHHLRLIRHLCLLIYQQ